VDDVDEALGRLGSDLKQGQTPQDAHPAEIGIQVDGWAALA
jgi:hypothetical protein